MVLCSDGTLYTGWTSDPQRRLQAHNRGRGAAYTRSRRPVRLVYVERCPSRVAAMRRECAIKRLTRSEKLSLIRTCPRRDRDTRPDGRAKGG